VFDNKGRFFSRYWEAFLRQRQARGARALSAKAAFPRSDIDQVYLVHVRPQPDCNPSSLNSAWLRPPIRNQRCHDRKLRPSVA
jgi:hypothetical protein